MTKFGDLISGNDNSNILGCPRSSPDNTSHPKDLSPKGRKVREKPIKKEKKKTTRHGQPSRDHTEMVVGGGEISSRLSPTNYRKPSKRSVAKQRGVGEERIVQKRALSKNKKKKSKKVVTKKKSKRVVTKKPKKVATKKKSKRVVTKKPKKVTSKKKSSSSTKNHEPQTSFEPYTHLPISDEKVDYEDPDSTTTKKKRKMKKTKSKKMKKAKSKKKKSSSKKKLDEL